MKVGSLFSGVGGFDLAFERVGMGTVWQVEIDGNCNDVLGSHWPEVRRYHDITGIDGRELEAADLICGGFPCQDLSVAGRRAGLAGERSGLWFEFHRILAEHRPAWAVVENVPGLLSSNGGGGRRGAVNCRWHSIALSQPRRRGRRSRSKQGSSLDLWSGRRRRVWQRSEDCGRFEPCRLS